MFFRQKFGSRFAVSILAGAAIIAWGLQPSSAAAQTETFSASVTNEQSSIFTLSIRKTGNRLSFSMTVVGGAQGRSGVPVCDSTDLQPDGSFATYCSRFSPVASNSRLSGTLAVARLEPVAHVGGATFHFRPAPLSGPVPAPPSSPVPAPVPAPLSSPAPAPPSSPVAVDAALAGQRNNAGAGGQNTWRVYAQLQSGQSTYCSNGGNLWVFESVGRLSLAVVKEPPPNAKLFTLPMLPDGSVLAEQKNPLNNRMIRLIVPAGSGPREFDSVDLIHGCRHRFKPW